MKAGAALPVEIYPPPPCNAARSQRWLLAQLLELLLTLGLPMPPLLLPPPMLLLPLRFFCSDA